METPTTTVIFFDYVSAIDALKAQRAANPFEQATMWTLVPIGHLPKIYVVTNNIRVVGEIEEQRLCEVLNSVN